MRHRNALSQNLPGLLTGLLLLAFAWTAWQMLAQAPTERRQVSAVRVTLPPEQQPVILGYQELGQNPASGRSAEKDHLRLRRGVEGGWWASNTADHRKIDAPTAKYSTRYLKRWRLATGDRIRSQTALIEVIALQGQTLQLRDASGREARWENGQLVTDEPSAAACPNEGSHFWRRWLQRPNQELFLFSLGGSVPCPHRWRLPGVAVRGLQVLWWDGAFWLAPGTTTATMSRKDEPSQSGHNFKNLEIRLDDPADPTQSLILGRTRYRLHWQDNALHLIPAQKTDLWRDTDWTQIQDQPRDPRVMTEAPLIPAPIQFGGLGDWLHSHWLDTLTALLLGLAAATLASKGRGDYHSHHRLRHGRAATLGLALALLILTLISWQPPHPQPAWLLLCTGLAWSIASAWLFASGRLQGIMGWLWIALIGLVGCGIIAQGQLGLGGDNSRWLDFSLDHWRVFTLSGCLLALLTALPHGQAWREGIISALDPWANKRIWLHSIVILSALILLALQFAFGGEEGIWGIQPVEGIKIVLALMLAHAGARLQRRRTSLSEAYRLHPLRTFLGLIGFILLFVLFASSLLWVVRDLSPFLLIALLLLLWLWYIAPHPTDGQPSRWALLGRWGIPACGIALALLFLWFSQAPEYIPRWMPQYDRFMVWADPAHFRESGFQIWRALELAAAGGWSGVADSPFGWNGAVMRLPVVQNDFIGTFVLYRFGIAGGWVLLAFQGLFTAALFTLARRTEQWGQEGDADQQATGAFLSIALFGIGCLFIAHWLIAWGNTLGLLPVMGQPMTFIAAANSHHLFFALPGLMLALVTDWIIHE